MNRLSTPLARIVLISWATALSLLAAGRLHAPACAEGGVIKEGMCEKTFKFSIKAGLPEYKFRVVWTQESAIELDRIEVTKGDDPKVLQTLTVEDSFAPVLSLEAQDVDFDGYNDLVFLADAGATGNTSYMVWLFDPKTNTFVAHPEFRDLTSMSVDPKSKRIHTHAKGGMAGMIYEDETYVWQDSKLVVVESETQEEIGESQYLYRTERKREGADLKVTREEIIQASEEEENGKTVCGPVGPPRTCGPEAAVIGFTMAEGDRDAEQMASHYAGQVMWNGSMKDKSALQAMHADYLKKIEDYRIELSDFHQTLAADGKAATVEATVGGEYHEQGKPGKTFKIVKRFRLSREGDNWLINCEEAAKYLDNTKGKTGNSCQLAK